MEEEVSKEPLLILSYLYIQHFKYDKAITLLRALRKLYPKDLDILRSLSYALLKVGDFQSALKMAEKSLHPNLPLKDQIACRIIISRALWGLGREEAARQAANQLIKDRTELHQKELQKHEAKILEESTTEGV